MQNVNVYNNVGVGMGYDDSKLSTFHMKKKNKKYLNAYLNLLYTQKYCCLWTKLFIFQHLKYKK